MSSKEEESLRREVARLREENEELRGHLRVGPANSKDGSEEKDEETPVAVLLLPDPLAPRKDEGLGPQAFANVARVLTNIMSERRPDLEWPAEHDLDRVPEGAQCFQVGHVVARVFGDDRVPPTYRVERGEHSESKLRRCLVPGEPESEQFLAGHGQLVQTFDDIAAEGEAAIAAGEDHHAGWALKALDLVPTQMNLAQVYFETDGDWREVLDKPRPEYLLPYGARIDATPVPTSP